MLWSDILSQNLGQLFNKPNPMASWPQATTLPSNVQLSPNANPALRDAVRTGQVGSGASSVRPAVNIPTQPTNAPSQPQPSQPSQPSQPNINEINQIYDPLNRAYDTYLTELEKQRPIAIEEARNQAATVENQLGTQLTQAGQTKNEAIQALDKAYRSAYDQAIRDANAARQQAMSRYGQGSSVGGAISEIIGQEFLRGTGAQRERKLGGIADAFKMYSAAEQFVNTKKGELQTALNTENKKINANFDQKLAEVNAKRYENEAARAAARYDILQQNYALAQNLANQKAAAELSLSVWKSQVQEMIKYNLASASANNNLTVPTINTIPIPSLSGTTTSAVPVLNSYQIKSPILSGKDLESQTFENLMNPYEFA